MTYHEALQAASEGRSPHPTNPPPSSDRERYRARHDRRPRMRAGPGMAESPGRAESRGAESSRRRARRSEESSAAVRKRLAMRRGEWTRAGSGRGLSTASRTGLAEQ